MAFALWYPTLVTFLQPPGCNLLPALAGLMLYRFYPTLSKLLFILSFISLWVMSSPIFAYNIIEMLQDKYPALIAESIDKESRTSAIVVLGAGSEISVENGNKIAVSSTELNRLRYAAWLHKKTGFPIIVSGGQPAGGNYTEANLMARTLRESFGVDTAIMENKGRNTLEESLHMRPVLAAHQLNTIYLITNAWHMPRSVEAFQRAGINVIPAPMGYYVYDHRYSILSYLPSITALHAMSLCMHEYIGMLWYHLKSTA